MKPGSSKSSFDKEGENQRVLDYVATTTTPIVAGVLPHLLCFRRKNASGIFTHI